LGRDDQPIFLPTFFCHGRFIIGIISHPNTPSTLFAPTTVHSSDLMSEKWGQKNEQPLLSLCKAIHGERTSRSVFARVSTADGPGGPSSADRQKFRITLRALSSHRPSRALEKLRCRAAHTKLAKFSQPNTVLKMAMLTQSKKPARKSVRRRAAIPAIPPSSPIFGHESAIGCVSIDIPRLSVDRRAIIRSRIHADNHR
jgi:hypothetical protein